MFVKITDQNFEKEVIEFSGFVLVEIEADWCGSCHIMAPIIEKIANQFQTRVKIGKLDMDTNKRTATEFGVTDMPIFLFFQNGKLVDHIIGAISKKDLEARIKNKLSDG